MFVNPIVERSKQVMKKFHVLIYFVIIPLITQCSNKSGTGPEKDIVPEITSGPNATVNSDKTATIKWKTNKECNSCVYFWPSEYPSKTDSVKSGMLTVNHNILITLNYLANEYSYYVESDDQVSRTCRSVVNKFKISYASEEYIKIAWASYEDNEFLDAISFFNLALDSDDTNPEIYLGLGWSYMYISNLTEAIQYLNKCLEFNAEYIDARAGIAFIYNAQKEYQKSVEFAQEVLTRNPEWASLHDSQTNYFDIHILLAECYFALGDYYSSLKHVQILNTGFQTDISIQSGIQDLAAEIERLNAIY